MTIVISCSYKKKIGYIIQVTIQIKKKTSVSYTVESGYSKFGYNDSNIQASAMRYDRIRL